MNVLQHHLEKTPETMPIDELGVYLVGESAYYTKEGAL